ncbi:hypothetical protein [Paenibacillus sp. GCM10012303]|uniref:hypothetical protein n=1 Tax=Paenibacillus sp. GCM10012303 TaxID=3317340 RepID=UPI00361983FC
MNTDKQIRDYAAMYDFTIRRIPNHGVKVIDSAGNERICTDIFSARDVVSLYKNEPLTSPVYEVGKRDDRMRLRLAAKNAAAAKRKFYEGLRLAVTDPDAVLVAKKIK